jgi:hypothetical protein
MLTQTGCWLYAVSHMRAPINILSYSLNVYATINRLKGVC